jgi:hypothetical protein
MHCIRANQPTSEGSHLLLKTCKKIANALWMLCTKFLQNYDKRFKVDFTNLQLFLLLEQKTTTFVVHFTKVQLFHP